mmetsp:Transcript_9901/g.23168  ORF Transcript_9901/g.23168 Transcript_9901/m.23168 type:complete len:219 (+) Transcript_9901:375-1031(+)
MHAILRARSKGNDDDGPPEGRLFSFPSEAGPAGAMFPSLLSTTRCCSAAKEGTATRCRSPKSMSRVLPTLDGEVGLTYPPPLPRRSRNRSFAASLVSTSDTVVAGWASILARFDGGGFTTASSSRAPSLSSLARTLASTLSSTSFSSAGRCLSTSAATISSTYPSVFASTCLSIDGRSRSSSDSTRTRTRSSSSRVLALSSSSSTRSCIIRSLSTRAQ